MFVKPFPGMFFNRFSINVWCTHVQQKCPWTVTLVNVKSTWRKSYFVSQDFQLLYVSKCCIVLAKQKYSSSARRSAHVERCLRDHAVIVATEVWAQPATYMYNMFNPHLQVKLWKQVHIFVNDHSQYYRYIRSVDHLACHYVRVREGICAGRNAQTVNL